MLELSRFYGLVVQMYVRDHAPPHFHAKYAEFTASFSIETLELIEGSLPRRAQVLVLEWANLHRDELRADWELAQRHQPLNPIDPLE